MTEGWPGVPWEPPGCTWGTALCADGPGARPGSRTPGVPLCAVHTLDVGCAMWAVAVPPFPEGQPCSLPTPHAGNPLGTRTSQTGDSCGQHSVVHRTWSQGRRRGWRSNVGLGEAGWGQHCPLQLRLPAGCWEAPVPGARRDCGCGEGASRSACVQVNRTQNLARGLGPCHSGAGSTLTRWGRQHHPLQNVPSSHAEPPSPRHAPAPAPGPAAGLLPANPTPPGTSSVSVHGRVASVPVSV